MTSCRPHLDITINSDALEDDLKHVLKVIKPKWKEDEIDFKGTERAGDAGLLNIMVVCFRKGSDKKDAVMCRIYRDTKFTPFTSHQQESTIMQFVHDQYGFAPKVLAILNNGFCYEYVVGEVMTGAILKLPDNMRLLAKQMALLHSTKTNAEMQHRTQLPDFFDSLLNNYPECLANYEKDKKVKASLPSKPFLLKEYNLVMRNVLNVGSDYVFCHGDTRAENIVWNKDTGEIMFVDWECCGIGKQAYEIGYHFVRYTGLEPMNFSLYPDKEYQFQWLRCYLETYFSVVKPNVPVTDADVKKLYAQVQTHALLFLIQATGLISSESDFDDSPLDFLKLSVSHYEGYKRLKEEVLALKIP